MEQWDALVPQLHETYGIDYSCLTEVSLALSTHLSSPRSLTCALLGSGCAGGAEGLSSARRD